MGCGGSKFDPQADPVPARILPLLRRRLDEIRRRRRNGGSSLKQSSTDLSKQELLKHGVSDDDNSSQPNQDSDSLEDSLKPSKTTPFEAGKAANDVEVAKELPPPPPTTTKSPKVAPEPEPEKLVKKTSFKCDNEEEDRRKEDDDDDEEIIEGGKITDDSLYPGSPSFRVYFIESLMNHKDDDDDEEEDHEKDDDSDIKSQSEDSHATLESINSCDGLVTKKKKKTRRVRRLRKVLPPLRRPAGAVKHLLNVKSCYTPGCGGHGKASLLANNTSS